MKEFKEVVKTKIIFFICSLFIVSFFLFLQRLFFYYLYREQFRDIKVLDIINAFVTGLRYDLTSFCIANFLFMLILLLSWSLYNNLIKNVLIICFLTWNAIFISYNFIDVIYFGISNKHITYEFENSWKESFEILSMGFINYKGYALLYFFYISVFIFIFYRFLLYIKALNNKQTANLKVEFFSYTFMLLILVFFTRGGGIFDSINIRDTFELNSKTAPISINGFFSTYSRLSNKLLDKGSFAYLKRVETAIIKENKQVVEYIIARDIEETNEKFPVYKRYKFKEDEFIEYNVVIFVMESWTSELFNLAKERFKISPTPFFDSIKKDGIYLKNCYANATRSLEGVAVILGSMPSWNDAIPGIPILGRLILKDIDKTHDIGEDIYQSEILSIPNLLSNKGYETFFIYGTHKSQYGLDELVKKIGIKKFISLSDFQGQIDPSLVIKETFFSSFGLHDEFVFLKAHELFDETKKPFFATIFSLSSHMPFIIPKHFKGLFVHDLNKLATSKFLNSVSYSDYALKKFFEVAKKSKYFDKTIFIIVSDHTNYTNDDFQSHRIPCLFYAPKIIKSEVNYKIVSQIDLLPTVLHIMKSSDHFVSWGKSIYSNTPRVALISQGINDEHVFIKDNYLIKASPYKMYTFIDIKNDPNKNLLEQQNQTNKEIYETALMHYNEYLNYLKLSLNILLKTGLKP